MNFYAMVHFCRSSTQLQRKEETSEDDLTSAVIISYLDIEMTLLYTLMIN